jgi:hypothetical protein
MHKKTITPIQGCDMKQLALLTLPLFITGCATIFESGAKPVTIESSVPAANFTVTNRAGHVVHSGVTPQRITLNNGAGYFKKEEYSIKMHKDGYEDANGTLAPNVAGWYYGNLLAGGLIGMLIVDPNTGAMYKLPDEYSVPMRKLNADEMAAAHSTTQAASADTARLPTASTKWQFQAEKLAQTSSCGQPQLASMGPGFEMYSTSCAGAPNTIRCDFGTCTVQ